MSNHVDWQNDDFLPDVEGRLSDAHPVGRIVELSGTVKWFDATKGYGFVIPDDGGADILLHVTCLRRDGFQTTFEGSRLVCEVAERPQGRQALRVISMDHSKAVHPGSSAPPRTAIPVQPKSGYERAVVKWFNRVRGYGFLTGSQDAADIFVHMEILRRFGFTELRPGQELFVRYGDSDRGLMATEVRTLDDPQVLAH